MEHVLAVYEMPHDPEVPVVAMDEQPVQLFKETRLPIPATRNHARRVDYEYERAGVASVFMFTVGTFDSIHPQNPREVIDSGLLIGEFFYQFVGR